MVALLVQNMERLDEQVKEEADGIYNTLGKKITLQSLLILKQSAGLRYSKCVMDSTRCIQQLT